MKWPFYKAVFIESLMLPNSMAFVIVLLGFAVTSPALPARGELCGALAAGGDGDQTVVLPDKAYTAFWIKCRLKLKCQQDVNSREQYLL